MHSSFVFISTIGVIGLISLIIKVMIFGLAIGCEN